MNWIDLVLLVGLGLFILNGLYKGAVRRLVQITAILVAFHQAWILAPWVRETILPHFHLSESWIVLVVPLLSFLIVYILLSLLGRWIASLFRGGITGVVDHVCGGILGLIIGVYALGFILRGGEMILPSATSLAEKGLSDSRHSSQLYYPILYSTKYTTDIIKYFRFDNTSKEYKEENP